MKKIKILLVDDQIELAEELKSVLETDGSLEVVGSAADGFEALKQMPEKQPDVVLMDIEMPEIDGVEASRRAIEKYPDLKIITLSMYSEEEYYTKMIDVGVRGFLLKNSQFEDVQKAILEVSEGNNYFSPEILDRIISNMYTKKTQKPALDLTEREIEVLYNI